MADPIQEQFILARRNQILDSAAKVFAEKGFHPSTVKDVAREAGVGDGTIYNYFDSKTALLLGIFDRMRASVQPTEGALNPDDGDFRRFLTEAFQYPLMALKGDNFALFRVIVSEMMVNKELRQLYFQHILEPTLVGGEQLLHQWAARHTIAPEKITLTIRAVSGIVLGLIIERIMGDSTLENQWDDLPAFLADLFMDGIGGDQS